VSSILSVSLDLPFGRLENLRIEERICCFCSDFIEDETHVLLNCPFYDDFRENLLNVAKSYKSFTCSSNNLDITLLTIKVV
jgi:hypothetical protein